jgi:hypothetical protein
MLSELRINIQANLADSLARPKADLPHGTCDDSVNLAHIPISPNGMRASIVSRGARL